MGFSFFSDLITPKGYEVPNWQNTDVTGIQQETVGGNLATLEWSKKLATDYNEFMQNQVAVALKRALPEEGGLQTQMAKNIAAKLKGQIPQDVREARLRGSNAKARAGGYAGGPGTMGYNLGTRDLGLTSLEMENQGEQAWAPFVTTVANLYQAPMFDPKSMFFSPQQRVAISMQDKQNQWNAQNLRNQMAAQPEPWMKAFAGLGDTAMNFAGAYLTMGGWNQGQGNQYMSQAQQQARINGVQNPWAPGGWAWR